MERMGGIGAILNAYPGDKQPAHDIINMFNFPDATRKDRLFASLASLTGFLEGAFNSSSLCSKSVNTSVGCEEQVKAKQSNVFLSRREFIAQ